MVECEFALAISDILLASGFNRYMVECEYHQHYLAGLVTMVLIDTWWNVNHYVIKRKRDNTSFNRYMVECELIRRGFLIQRDKVLIDTWWNVNIVFKAKYIANTTVLIDTWWNVN